ncbi:MAG: spore coat protein [Bacillota bacterium]
MKFGMREAVEMFEMVRDSACMIDHFSDYINHCQDPSLRQILEKQQRHLVEEYNHKLSVMQAHGLDTASVLRTQSDMPVHQGGTMAAVPGMQANANIQFGIQQTGQNQSPVQARTRAISDRTIAQGALLFHKCLSSRANTAALESAEPHLRNLLSNSARTCMDMAYEMFNYMVQRGFYQTPEAPRNFINHMQQQGAQNYQGAQQSYPGMQQNVSGIQQHPPGVQWNYQAGTQQGNPPRQFS